MKKLRLELDGLRVESFGTGGGAAGGTVNAHEMATDPILDPGGDTSRIDSCYFDTCYEGCDWTD